LSLELRIDAFAIVRNRKEPFPAALLGCDAYTRRSITPVLNGVPNQVLHQLSKMDVVPEDSWQMIVGDYRPALLNSAIQVVDRCLQDPVDFQRL
jgi:hypothetical protein